MICQLEPYPCQALSVPLHILYRAKESKVLAVSLLYFLKHIWTIMEELVSIDTYTSPEMRPATSVV